MMSGRTAESVIRAMVDALNKGDVEEFVGFYAPNVVIKIMESGETIEGVDAIRTWISDAYSALDGFSNDIVGIYSSENTVALEVIARGRATREFSGRVAGENFDNPELYVYEVDNGKVTEARLYL